MRQPLRDRRQTWYIGKAPEAFSDGVNAAIIINDHGAGIRRRRTVLHWTPPGPCASCGPEPPVPASVSRFGISLEQIHHHRAAMRPLVQDGKVLWANPSLLLFWLSSLPPAIIGWVERFRSRALRRFLRAGCLASAIAYWVLVDWCWPREPQDLPLAPGVPQDLERRYPSWPGALGMAVTPWSAACRWRCTSAALMWLVPDRRTNVIRRRSPLRPRGPDALSAPSARPGGLIRYRIRRALSTPRLAYPRRAAQPAPTALHSWIWRVSETFGGLSAL